MYACWSVKGGSGTTVFACSLALALSERHGSATIIDLNGDVPAVLGMAEPTGRGVRDWLGDPVRESQDLSSLRVTATSRLHLIPAGSPAMFDEASLLDLAAAVTDNHTVIDFGSTRPPDSLRDILRADWLVTRACYLALRRAARLSRRPGGVVLLREEGRALTTRDVQSVVGTPVVAEITVSDAIARCVDAGLLATRLPKGLAEELSAVL